MVKTNKKILVVEDDEDFLEILKINFKNNGISIITARDGEEGLILAEKEKPDLILSDILMPRMDGIEMAKRIKEKNTNIPIIFLTNVSSFNCMSKAIEIAPSSYIVKSNMSFDKIVAETKKKLGLE